MELAAIERLKKSPYIYNGSKVSDRCPLGYLFGHAAMQLEESVKSRIHACA